MSKTSVKIRIWVGALVSVAAGCERGAHAQSAGLNGLDPDRAGRVGDDHRHAVPLDEWLEEVRAKRPLSKLEVMEREMERAIDGERYERAAELRDAIRLIKTRPEVGS